MTSSVHELLETRQDEVRIDRLLGRQVVAANGRPAGRLEEFRAEIRDGEWIITEYVLGLAGFAARLGGSVRAFFNLPSIGYVARWDQIDLSNVETPRLTCSVDELQKLGSD
jgi:hypothetical protein